MSNRLNDYLKQAKEKEVKDWINKNLINYLKKNDENVQEIEHIIDYLNSEDRPKRIRYMSYEEALNNTSKWTKKLIKKGGNIIETDKDTKVIHDFKNGMKLVQLIGANAFKREGHIMRHCVGSYVNRNDVRIYSLRDKNSNPHCTIEVQKQNDTISQIKGKGNGSIHPKYIKYILKSLKKIGKDINTQDMQYLGYISDEEYIRYVEKHFDGVKFIIYNNKKFIYKYSKLIKKDDKLYTNQSM